MADKLMHSPNDNTQNLEKCLRITFITSYFIKHIMLYNTSHPIYFQFTLQSRTLSACPQISVTAEPIRLFFSGNIITSPAVVLSYFVVSRTPLPSKRTPPPSSYFVCKKIYCTSCAAISTTFSTNGAKPLAARNESTGPYIKVRMSVCLSVCL